MREYEKILIELKKRRLAEGINVDENIRRILNGEKPVKQTPSKEHKQKTSNARQLKQANNRFKEVGKIIAFIHKSMTLEDTAKWMLLPVPLVKALYKMYEGNIYPKRFTDATGAILKRLEAI